MCVDPNDAVHVDGKDAGTMTSLCPTPPGQAPTIPRKPRIFWERNATMLVLPNMTEFFAAAISAVFVLAVVIDPAEVPSQFA